VLSASGVSRPNILFILTDDQSIRSISAYREAHAWVRTPQIDTLARNGVLFRNAYIGTWCMPARLSLLTGRMPYAVKSMRMVGNYPGASYNAALAPFWPKVFREHGYTTAQIGKWHTGQDAGFGRDWDYQAVWQRPTPDPKNILDDSGYYYDQRISFNGAPPRHVDGYATDNYTTWAADFIKGENRPADKPWYLWLCYTAPHAPFEPATRHVGDYEGVPVSTPADIYPPRPGTPAYMQEMQRWVSGPDGLPRKGTPKGPTLQSEVRQYNQVVSAVDENIGRLIEALEDSGQLENTLVVFTSDQGFAWGQHGFRHKVGPYDANLRAPLIVSMPGTVPAGKVVESPVGGIDLIPTFFRFAGIELPWRMHGHDLAPLLADSPFEPPSPPVLLSYNGWTFGDDTARIPEVGHDAHPSGVSWYVSLREGSHKYIRTLTAGETEELYDLDSDPEELFNLASAPAQKSRLDRMRKAVLAELRRTEAPFAEYLPAIQSSGQ
jgi:arylsulfatase A-like enzyme